MSSFAGTLQGEQSLLVGLSADILAWTDRVFPFRPAEHDAILRDFHNRGVFLIFLGIINWSNIDLCL